MAVKGLAPAPGAIVEKVQKMATIYLEAGIATLTTARRQDAPVNCYPGTSAVIKVHDDGRPESGWLDKLGGEWTVSECKLDTKNRDVYALDLGVAKFSAGKAHVAAYPGTVIVVAEGQALNSTTGTWKKISGAVARAEKVEKATEPAKAAAK